MEDKFNLSQIDKHEENKKKEERELDVVCVFSSNMNLRGIFTSRRRRSVITCVPLPRLRH